MRARCRLIAVVLVMLAAPGGCSNGDGQATAAPTSYVNEVDGIAATWPVGWRQKLEPLDAGTSDHVQLLALTTFRDPVSSRDAQCAPYPEVAMRTLKQGEALFVLWTTPAPVHDRPPRPNDLLASARPRPAGDPPVQAFCFPSGVDARLASFRAHGTHYEAFIAAREPLSGQLRREIQQIWEQLKIRPIELGLKEAELGRPYWHNLYTHCGIRGTTFDGRDWIADPELSDGQGNPPREWADARGGGTITLVEEDVAIFEGRSGKHTARFRPRTPADAPMGTCQ